MVLPFKIITESAAQTQKLGEKLGSSFLTQEGSRVPRVLCLWGELGSGKTTFVQGLAKGLGVTSRLLSPTFIIVRHHDIPAFSGILYHLDLYRIATSEDARAIGFTDMVNEPGSLVVVEWPERLGGLLPEKRADIRFETLPDGRHNIIGGMYG